MPTRPEVELRSELHTRTHYTNKCADILLPCVPAPTRPHLSFLFFPMQYCESPVYTTWEPSAAETVKVAFQCRQPDGTYGIGQETIGAGSTHIDPLFGNNEVEWYTERIGSPVLYGLLIKLQ